MIILISFLSIIINNSSTFYTQISPSSILQSRAVSFARSRGI